MGASWERRWRDPRADVLACFSVFWFCVHEFSFKLQGSATASQRMDPRVRHMPRNPSARQKSKAQLWNAVVSSKRAYVAPVSKYPALIRRVLQLCSGIWTTMLWPSAALRREWSAWRCCVCGCMERDPFSPPPEDDIHKVCYRYSCPESWHFSHIRFCFPEFNFLKVDYTYNVGTLDCISSFIFRECLFHNSLILAYIKLHRANYLFEIDRMCS